MTPPRRRTARSHGEAALLAWRAGAADRPTLATAVRYTLEALADNAPGISVEVRVPPFAAVQCVAGVRHTRGTPPSVVETDAETWLALATGGTTWVEAVAGGAVRASGERSDLAPFLPLAPGRGGLGTVGS